MSQSTLPDDESLVARCRAGDATAWEALVRRYQRLVYAIALRAGIDEQAAADVFQTVFLRLLQHLQRIADPAKLQAWIVTTAKREALLQCRRGQRTMPLTVSDDPSSEDEEQRLVDESPGPEETLESWQQLAQVRLALDALDARCRQLLEELFGGDHVGYDEVGRRLGIPVGSIGPTRARCLAKLRRSLD